MSRTLIKSGLEAERIGSALTRIGAQSDETASRTAHDEKLEELSEEIARLHAELDRQQHAHDLAIKKAREDARAEAMANFKRNDAERLEALKSGLGANAEQFRRALDQLEDATAMLAVDALKPLLSTPDTYAELIAKVVQRQVSQLKAGSLVEVTVSSDDFADADALKSQLNEPELQVRLDPETPQGEVRSRLKLGWLECSIPGYWKALQDLVVLPLVPGETR